MRAELYSRLKHGKGIFAVIRRAAKFLLAPTSPRVPGLLKPAFRLIYEGYWLALLVARAIFTLTVRQPLFQSRCASVGRRLALQGPMPFVAGPVEIFLGDRVAIGGKVSVLSGGPIPNPKLIVKDRVAIGWNTTFSVGREIVIEEDVIVSYDCRISDTDGHPRQADLRAQNCQPRPEDVRPVRICRNAFISNGTHVMKGVTIGEGAVVGANSVVITDIPPYSLAMGNPADVLIRNYGKPSKARVRNTEAAQATAAGGGPAGTE